MAVSANATTLIFNDATTQPTAAVVSTSTVLSATAGASVGAVGSYALCIKTSTATLAAGNTLAGASLRYAGGASTYGGSGGSTVFLASGTPSGTWRLMGYIAAFCQGCQTFAGASLWLRTV